MRHILLTQASILQLTALFAVPMLIYIVLDMLFGKIIAYMFNMQLFQVMDWVCDMRSHDLECMFRTLCFAISLCIWSFPVFIFQTAKNIYLKILCCFTGAAIIVWYALATWLSLLAWEDQLGSWVERVTNSSFYLPLLAILSVLAGIGLFYVGFAIIFYRILNTNKQTAIEAEEINDITTQ